jgi:ABC-type uncharacterized transport system involved in gliding motility auxiliary subunit
MTPRHFLLASSTLIAALFVAATLLLYPLLAPARMDFTENALFKLSEETRSIVRNLDEPVELTFVYTRRVGQDYPAIRAYATRVRELLHAYEAGAGSNLRINEIDPQPFSAAEDEAVAAGIRTVDTEGNDPLYFGIIGRNSIDEQRVLSFLAPEQEETLEYDLTRLIARLDQPDAAIVGVLSSLPGMQGDGESEGYTLLREIAKTFTLDQIDSDFLTLPEEMDVLLLAHPPELSDWQTWLIDQFLMRRGRAVILIDAAAKTSEIPDRRSQRRIRSDLGRFAAVWGVRLSDAAVADTETALAVQAASSDGRSSVVRHPLYVSIPPAMMSADSILTAPLSRSVNFGAPGGLILDDASPIAREILIKTGPAPSWIEPGEAVKDLDVEQALALYEPVDGPQALAVRVHGTLVSAFPDGAPDPVIPEDPVLSELARKAVSQAGDHISSSEASAEILILSDADMVDDGLYVDLQNSTAFADNGALIMNALDMMAGDANLLGLRARASSRRTMTRVEAMRDEAQTRFFDEQSQLESRLSSAQARLEELQQIGTADRMFDDHVEAGLNAEERHELIHLKADVVDTRERLRGIERDFRREIDTLEAWLKFLNIFGGAILVGAIGFLVGWRRRRKVAR